MDNTEVTDAQIAPAPTLGRTPRLVVVISILGGLLVLAAGIWYVGPWSAEWRYNRSSLVSLRRASTSNPKDQLAWRTMGLRLAGAGDPMAELPLREANALKPSDVEVATALGELLLLKGEIPEAFQLLKGAVGQQPDQLVARMALGRLYERRGAYHLAAEQFNEVSTRDKKYVDAWYELAVCYLQMQQAAKAQDAIDEAIKLYPNDAHYLALKGSIEAAVGNIRHGLDLALRASDLAPENIKINVNFVTMLLANQETPEDLDTAERIVTRVEKLGASLPVLAYHRGEIARLRGRYTEAIPYYEQAIQRAPGLLEAYFALSQAYRKAGRVADASKVAKAYRIKQAARQSIEDMRILVAANPNDVRNLVKLADLQAKSGDYAAATETLKTADEIDPNDPEVRKRADRHLKSRNATVSNNGAPAP